MNEILKQLELILARGYSSYTVFIDFIDLILYALQCNDPPYFEIVSRYNNDRPIGHREIDFFHIAFHLLLHETEKTNSDVLGELYMRWNMENKLRGQYFTPPPIACFMSKVLNPTKAETIFDPACGSGVMLVECIKNLTQEDLDSTWFFGQDIDLTCTKMTALNLCFFNVNGYAIQGDTLAFECNKVYQTQRSMLGGSVKELQGEELVQFQAAYKTLVSNTLKSKPHIKEQIKEINNKKVQEQFEFIFKT